MALDLVNEFLTEADELFVEAEKALLAMDKGQDFLSNYNALFRSYHSIKGAAGMFGLDRLQEHMHYLENLIEKKKNQSALSHRFIDYLLKSIDVAKDIIEQKDVTFEYYDPDNLNANNNNDDGLFVNHKSFRKLTDKKNLIYVIDDEQDLLDILKGLIEDHNYEVKTFLSAQLALEELKIQPADLIISDIKMPDMDGLELMAEVNRVLPQIPVILLSGHVTKEACIEALKKGVSGIIEKPVNEKILMKQLNHCIDRYMAFKLLNWSIDLLVFQFNNVDEILKGHLPVTVRETILNELKTILILKKKIVDRFKLNE